MTSDTAMLSALLHGLVLADQRERLKQHASTHFSFSHSQLRGSLSASGLGSRVPVGQVLVSVHLGTVASAVPPAAALASAEQGDSA
eukprot:1912198-Rhodomonas_salina.1